MKKVAIAVIVILVVIAGVLVFKLLSPEKNRPQNPETRTMEASTVADTAPVEKIPERKFFRQPSKNPHFGKFFDYRQVVWDDKLPFPGGSQVHGGILVDLNTHKVLWAKNPRQAAPVASMTKMMTLLLAFEALDKRTDLTLATPVKVTSEAAGIGGSQVYLDVRETHPFGELLKAMAIKSANDCAYLVGEYVSGGNMPEFIRTMNRRAYELKMPSTNFVNVHGLTSDGQKDSVSSPEGMAILAEQLLQYPQLIHWTSAIHEYFRPQDSPHCQFLTNTNHHLLKEFPGVNGMKTGYTKTAGFCVTATCIRGGRTLVAAVTGFKRSKERTAFVKRLLNWGYQRAAELEAAPAAGARKVRK
ncbi:MAG: D-alanyl-D-alanine carboxypeptidase [Victivallales bacterium]|nr:D-alanyl-D-alanine carboxypeptidase [Victivallales bacterium]